MNATHIDVERLTESAGAGRPWSEPEAAHLAGCADCRLELEMLAAARRLGASQLAGFDPARVSAAVRRRLDFEGREAPTRAGRRWMGWLTGLAAAAVIVFAVYTGMPKSPNRETRVVPLVSVLPELDGLNAPELEEVLQSIPLASEALEHVDMAPLTDLDASALERMLRSMEE